MQKVVIHRPGGFERLELVEAPSLEPGPNEVVVGTRSIGVNFADCVVRMGLYSSAKDYVGWPITPGFEFSGIVLRVGSNVTSCRVGDEVFGVSRFGAYASEVCVEEEFVYPLPAGLDLASAGGFLVASLTAWYGLRELSKLRPGMRVLVHSAAGGVGSILVQIAKICGAEVAGVVGATHKVDVVRALGADRVIDKSRENLWAAAKAFAPDGFDVVLDANGVETLRSSYRALRPTGRLVVYGFHSMLSRGSGRRNWLKLAWTFARTPRFDPLDMTDSNRAVLAFNLSYLFEQSWRLRESMDELLAWLGDGRLKIASVTEYALTDVRRAHEDLQSGKTVGKLVLVPESDRRSR